MTTRVQSPEHYWQLVVWAAHHHLTPDFIERMSHKPLDEALAGIISGMAEEGHILLGLRAEQDRVDAIFTDELQELLFLAESTQDQQWLIQFFGIYAQEAHLLSQELTDWVMRWHVLTAAVLELATLRPLLPSISAES
jgi:hypothetical protein